MTYVITQSCCNDATCILDCPVDCIRPTPGDPGFVNAEMLYIDPDSCIDCGACQDACPVGAVYPDYEVPEDLVRFAAFNADYFRKHPLEQSVGTSGRAAKPDATLGTLRVAIVGSGPSAAYLAEDLLERGNVQVDMIDRLPTPWGLLRAGVAPDHVGTKDLAKVFAKPFASAAFSYHLNVEVGSDVTVADLLGSHHAVVVATGAADPAPWEIPGADLAGVHPATDFVAWYNGHPDFAEHDFDLTAERAIVVGNGNVALDVARLLVLGPEELAASDAAAHAVEALGASSVREVVVVGRRGPLQAAYTSPEFAALGSIPGVEVVIDPDEVTLDSASQAHLRSGSATFAEELKVKLAVEYSDRPRVGEGRRLVFRYLCDPVEVVGADRVEAVEFTRTELVAEAGRIVSRPIAVRERIEAGLVLTSIGYRGRELPGVPFDAGRAIIPHQEGRVVDLDGITQPGLYAVGWAKRGATGGIGANRADAQETAAAIVADFNAAALSVGSVAEPASLAALLQARNVNAVSSEGWKAIDAHESATGGAAGRPRLKLVGVTAMLDVAATA
jgi:ferredoxin--NADP+ reductase